jgi:two-component system phosphate regulon sensor histidine kinase PhoR
VDKARSREMGGTGLGLSIVKHLTQAMHGSVCAASRPGQGTTFTIRLPCAADLAVNSPPLLHQNYTEHS